MKKGILVLTILFAALAAWIVAFPDKNPFAKLFAKPATPGQPQPIITAAKTAFVASPTLKTSVFSPPAAPVQDSDGFPLMTGSRGQYVRWMQAGLNNNYGCDLTIDGIFGSRTYKAVSATGFNADAVDRGEYLKIING